MTITPMRFVFALLLTALIPLFWFLQVVKDREVIRAELGQEQAKVSALTEIARQMTQISQARDEIDQRRTKELKSALDQNKTLQRDVDDGRKRLLVKARCPAPAIPGATGTASVADAGSAELAADARSDYFTLVDQLALTRQMLLGLQDYVRTVVQRPPANP